MTQPDFIDLIPYADMALPPDTERAWAAGFFDGEGWIGSNHAKGYTYVKMAVVQTGSRITLDRFNAAIGGVGQIYERSKNTPSNWADGWTLQVNAIERVVFAVNMIWPWLSQPKRDQAVAAFEKRSAYRSQWSTELKRRNQRLTPENVRELRRRFAAKESRTSIAAAFGVDLSTVYRVASGKMHGGVR
jgi:hypothetical protein